ncbi:hypothetical protein RB195_001156 [Necator americanus]|uniref:Uncharacterized protein n=1 Tax=Necator americanus TaxID=51031 RepID=A0ABR1DDF4_NECAM
MFLSAAHGIKYFKLGKMTNSDACAALLLGFTRCSVRVLSGYANQVPKKPFARREHPAVHSIPQSFIQHMD